MGGYAEHARSLVGYNQWANDKILRVTKALSPKQLAEDQGASFGSIEDSLRHILLAQLIWVMRFKGADSKGIQVPGDEVLDAAFARSHEELAGFISQFTDDDWNEVLVYTDSRGEKHERPLGSLVTHLVNHGTYHRGEAALMLSRAGHSPGDLDYLYYIPG